MKCHICEAETDFTCQQCGEPVCEGCCVVPTYQNQIDYALCTSCQDGNEARHWLRVEKQAVIDDARAAKNLKAKETRRKNYFKPENVEKRRLRKLERAKRKSELKIEQLKSLARILKSFNI